ncbi:glycyl aminopeptidase. Metallo peptidase. MEROPS family M61 [Granulicella rosea]|uniref:Glycyl aminopeptidase. Metallo peptidase. MEROPS family M61 n=1 Tax=Granulicella rosea TaxID=474952 RepID=A0A239L1E6_9BACT|nr:M61 family metallopeptidase [Granulicella rosea]SNT24120.1 glycyl aminopeptidase. Metallo peptidase. MEROPS family M61 [Granulicella rosea]
MSRFLFLALGATALFAASAAAQKTPITITADLSEASRKLYHAEIDIPVTAGSVQLTTPAWIPGNHRQTGPVDDITGVVFTADGKVLPWRRDDKDLYSFHVTVPKGVTTLHAHLDCIVTSRATSKMAVLEWEKLLLYPAKTPVKDIAIQPNVTVPAGWGIGTALTPTGTGAPPPVTGVDEGQHGPTPGAQTTHYAATTVEQLEDSPVISGQYFHEFPLAPEVTPKHYIDVVSDAPEDSNLRPEVLAEVSNLVRETGAIYGSRHYNVYHFLLTLSDIAGGEGLEHGQSSDNGIGERGFADNVHQLGESDLLAHEFTHSWNGKYRRPYNLYKPDFEQMQEGSLLWVYEGMTQYLGNVLAARSGLKSASQYRDILALSAAQLDYKRGRQWRSTEDTAIAASILRGGSPAWSNWKRGQDYYQEGELFWLDVDTLIRKSTDNKKTLDDFQKIFLGKGGNTGPLIVTYNREELIKDLNQVMPYDWATFIHEHIDVPNPHADLDGIERGGYKLVFNDKPNDAAKTLAAASSRRSSGSFWYSLGLTVSGDGVIGDVLWSGPADVAKLAPGTKIIAVNGNAYTPDALHDAIKAAKGGTEAIHLITQVDTFIGLTDLHYHDGERYPAFVPNGNHTYLDDITKPLTTPEVAPKAPAGKM